MRPSPVASLRAYLIGLVGLFFYSVFVSFVTQIGIRLGIFAYVINIIFQWLAFALPALLYYEKNRSLQPCMRVTLPDPISALAILAAAAVGTLALNWVSMYWVMILSSLGLVIDLGGNVIANNVTELIGLIIYGALAPAVFEELLFRGFLLPSFEMKGRKIAIVTSALLFALLHGSIEALPAHIILGVILAMLAMDTGSIYAPMLYHAAHNGLLMIISYNVNGNAAETAEALPTVAEAIATLPSVLILLALWGTLLSFACRMGKRKGDDRLPPAEKAPLPITARGMLVVVAVLLLVIQFVTIYNMLPGTQRV